METVTKKTWHNVDIKGNWKLVYTVGNPEGATAFGGLHMPVYPNPFTGERTFLKDVDQRVLKGYMMDKLVKWFKPEENMNDLYLISWLICHPMVKVQGVPELDSEIIKKKSGNKLTLYYLDYLEVDKIDDEDFIDSVIGRISTGNFKTALSLEKLRHIMAHLGLPYQDKKYEGDTEKKVLRAALKKFVKKGKAQATIVKDIIDDLQLAKEHYEFKEIIRLKVIDFETGLYKYNKVPLGSSFDGVQEFFHNHPEVRTEILTQLYKKLEQK